ncbi:hypothetical protein like AT4G29090 [Hibiscus trionum]|uniref:Reverse transcriptase zinc-binding domain-containing protein n=1 Tax=Hibiscus trionum TaxID=183268 RepID=A0A9W7H5U4_HIBTR|nr:hypothetical protein like AT4G29090 [Hibiscus trionum]
MPLPSINSPDIRIWRGDDSGVYSVRSGYRWLINSTENHSGDPNLTRTNTLDSFYGALLSLRLPSKIKIIFWKFANNFMPIFGNLSIRHIQVNPPCLLCSTGSESVLHFSQDYTFVKQVLSKFNITLVPITDDQSFIIWMANFFKGLSTTSCRIFVTVIWAIWFTRNKLQHEGKHSSMEEVFRFVVTYLQEVDASSSVTLSPPPPRRSAERWIPPESDVIKANFDASYDQQNQSSISGVV